MTTAGGLSVSDAPGYRRSSRRSQMGYGLLLRAAFGAMVIHLLSAVSAVQKPGQRIRFSQRVDALWRLAELLCKLPCLPVHDGLVGVLKDQPILLGIHHGVFILVGLLVRAEIHRMPHILRLGEDLSHDIAATSYRDWKIPLCFSRCPCPACRSNTAGRFHLILKENAGNVIGAFALDGQIGRCAAPRRRLPRRSANGICSPGLSCSRRWRSWWWACRIPLDTDGGFLLAAQVAQIPFVHDVEEGGKLIAVLVIAVHAVGDGNKVNTVLPEEHLRVKAGLQVVTPRPAHILDDHMGNLARLNICDELLPCRTLKIAAAPAVIRIVSAVGVASLLRHSFRDIFSDSRWNCYPRRCHRHGTAAHRAR